MALILPFGYEVGSLRWLELDVWQLSRNEVFLLI